MRIKKTSQTTPIQAQVVNTYDESEENTYSCDYINTKINNITGKVLWTNPNPNSNFNNATINLNSSDYDMLEILYKHNVNDSYLLSQKTLKGQGIILMTHSATGDLFRKTFTATSTTLTTTDSTETFIVPIYVIGYKTGLFNV